MKSWGAQKWSKVNYEGRVLVLVERDKEAQEWVAVDLDAREVVRIKAETEIEVAEVLSEDAKRLVKKECKAIAKGTQGNSSVQEDR